jgi:16S rRNA processing protein RimM
VTERLVPIGRVGRPHGVDGAFVVEQASEDEQRWRVGASLLVDGEAATITVARRVGGRRLAIRLDRDVERGAELAIPLSELPEPDEDTYYAFQLVGLAVVEDGGRELGSVRDVHPGPANDALELDSGLLLPLVEDCILAVDLGERRILVARGFADDR